MFLWEIVRLAQSLPHSAEDLLVRPSCFNIPESAHNSGRTGVRDIADNDAPIRSLHLPDPPAPFCPKLYHYSSLTRQRRE